MAPCSRRGQDMVGPRPVVSHRFRRVRSEKNGARMPDAGKQSPGVRHLQLQVFRSQQVGHFHCLVQGLHFYHRPVVRKGLFGHRTACKICALPFQLGRKRCQECGGSDNTVSRRQWIMFRLGKQVAGHKIRPGRFVRHHQDFTGAGKHVNPHLPRHFSLGQGHKQISRAHDFVHRRNAFRPVRQGGDCLGAAALVNSIRPGNFCRQQRVGIYRPVALRRGCQHHSFHTGHTGRDDSHQHGRRVGGRAARHIGADRLQGDDALTPEAAVFPVFQPGIAQLPGMKRADVFRRLL